MEQEITAQSTQRTTDDSLVGDDGSGTSQAEQAVADQHGAVLAQVVAVGDVLVVHNQGPLVWQRLHGAQCASAEVHPRRC